MSTDKSQNFKLFWNVSTFQEEMTLYIIQQDEKLNQQEKRINDLERKIKH